MTALLALLVAAANRLRGSGLIRGRWRRLPLTAAIAGCGAGLYDLALRHDPAHAGWVFLAVALGFALWAVPGWGKYFSAFHAKDDPSEAEIRWIDRLGYRVFPTDGTAATNRRRGTFCMALRGLYLYPTFAALAFLTSPWALLIGLGCLLQGPAYGAMRFARQEYGIPGGEILTGAAFGWLIATTLGTGVYG